MSELRKPKFELEVANTAENWNLLEECAGKWWAVKAVINAHTITIGFETQADFNYVTQCLKENSHRV